jgi:hypothetical protein
VRTPVVLFLFNRPECTRQVFAVIRQVRPRQLFVVADGPRPVPAPVYEQLKASVLRQVRRA